MGAILEVLRKRRAVFWSVHTLIQTAMRWAAFLAMGMLLEQMGKRAESVTADRVPSVYRGLPGVGAIRHALRIHGPYDAR